MRLDADYTSPIENTVRKVMIIQLLRTLDTGMRTDAPSHVYKELQSNGVTGFIVKGSSENCFLERPQAIGRNPRDLDLIAIGSVLNHYQDRRENILHVLENAAQKNGFLCSPTASGLSIHDHIVGWLHTKTKSVASIRLTREWLDNVIMRREELRLTDRDVGFLTEARERHIGKTVLLKLDVTVNQPVQDLPPHNAVRRPLETGVGVHDPHISLINKLQAANFILRNEEFHPMTHALDIVDVYNINHRFAGLNDRNIAIIEDVIRHGKVYRNRQRLQTAEAGGHLLARGDVRPSSWASLRLGRDKRTITEPTQDSAQWLKGELDKAYDANLLDVPITLAQAEQMLSLAHTLSDRIWENQKKGPSSSMPGVFISPEGGNFR